MEAMEKIIDRIAISKSNNKAVIYFNSGEIINLNLDIILKYKLIKGKLINSDEYEQIIKEERLINAKQKAYNFVSYKRRTEKQIIDKLKKENFEPDEINGAIAFLNQFNYIDDRKFAKDYVADYLLRKSAGQAKLKLELIKKGIRKDIAEEALKNVFPEEDARELINRAIEKKMRLLSSKPKDKQKNSLIAYLQRQGFAWSLIKEALADLFADNYNDDENEYYDY